MSVAVDPEENESRAILRLARMRGQEILEVGCGDGRLTWRIAPEAAHIIAIDPYEPSIARARSTIPEGLESTVELHVTSFKDFAATRPKSAYDAVVFSWSLC